METRATTPPFGNVHLDHDVPYCRHKTMPPITIFSLIFDLPLCFLHATMIGYFHTNAPPIADSNPRDSF